MIRGLHWSIVALAVFLTLGSGHIGGCGASARQSMSFSTGERSRGHASASRHRRHGHFRGRATHGGHGGRARGHQGSRAAARTVDDGGGDTGDAAKAVPGKGFTMQNGVLTYPAPARFLPKNLPHR